MKAIRIRAFETEPTLEEIPPPDVAPGEVLVRVEAAALNPLDALVASGVARRFFTIEPPITLGTDLAGTIVAVGPGVDALAVGDPVIAWLDAGRGGALAEFAAVPAESCVVRPAGMPAVAGSAIPTAGITAWHALFSKARLAPGETVLIHAAAGGVGSFAVQFARLGGARVIATASGDGIDLARRMGAGRVIDYRVEDAAAVAEPVDVVLDLVGGRTQARSFAMLRPGGRLVSTVEPPDPAVAAAHGVEAAMVYAAAFADRLGDLVATIVDNRLTVVLDSTTPIADFDAAWARQTSRRARGKIVVLP